MMRSNRGVDSPYPRDGSFGVWKDQNQPMAKTYRIGVIGFAHMHINEHLRAFAALPNVQWIACADTVPLVPELVKARFTRQWNLEHAQSDIGIPTVYDDYGTMLERERFDIVLFCPENARHAEVARAIAAHGAHMVTEKPMATSLADARSMADAARAAGVSLMVNWPTTWSPAVRKAKELLDAGAIGRLLEVKWRAGSMGPLSHGSTHPGVDGTAVPMTDEQKGATWWHQQATGGGVLLDYCCYGACLARWYARTPAQAAFGLTANLNSPYGDAEDNAIVTVRFPGALALLEATWTTVDHGVPTGPILYGETGTMVVERRGAEQVVRLIQERAGEPRLIPGDPLPTGRATLAEEFLHHLETGEPLHETLQVGFNLDAMAILDAAIRSTETKRMEAVEQV
jgi:predicted dehydrogenase